MPRLILASRSAALPRCSVGHQGEPPLRPPHYKSHSNTFARLLRFPHFISDYQAVRHPTRNWFSASNQLRQQHGRPLSISSSAAASFEMTPSQVTKLAVCAMQPRWLSSCSDDGVIKVWDVAMPNEPIISAATGSKTVTDLAFHPQRRGTLPALCWYPPKIITLFRSAACFASNRAACRSF